jgi:hypothetical protein
MIQNKITPIPKPTNLALVCVEYDDKLVVGKYVDIQKGFIELDNAITLSTNQNAKIQHQKGVYPVKDNNVTFRWNGENYTIPKNGHNMTVSYGKETRNLKGYIDMHVGVPAVQQKLRSAGNQELADIVSTYNPRK